VRLGAGEALWLAQRGSALVLAGCVLVHLATIAIAVRGGLSAAEILDRTRGSALWGVFYALFVAAIAVHAPIGMRNILREWMGWRGRAVDLAMVAMALGLAVMGGRAVVAVVGR
jgi:fumarate reductase subunit C